MNSSLLPPVGIKVVGTSIADHAESQRGQGGIDPDIGWERRNLAIVRINRQEGASIYESGTDKDFPNDATHDFPKEDVASLVQG